MPIVVIIIRHTIVHCERRHCVPNVDAKVWMLGFFRMVRFHFLLNQLFARNLGLPSQVLERPLGCRLIRSPIQLQDLGGSPFVGISHRTHLNGDTRYRYFGCKLDIGQQTKNTPPIKNHNSLMQNAALAKSEKIRAEPKKYSEATVFSGYLQWYKLARTSAE